jgi:hypothetical protein
MKPFWVLMLAGYVLTLACGEVKPQLATLQLQVGQKTSLHNEKYPNATFTLAYVANRPAPVFNDFYLEYEYPVAAGGTQKNQTLAECDSFPLDGVLGPGDDHVRFELEFTCYPNYVEVTFPPGWSVVK